jgi:hypothetical protein
MQSVHAMLDELKALAKELGPEAQEASIAQMNRNRSHAIHLAAAQRSTP